MCRSIDLREVCYAPLQRCLAVIICSCSSRTAELKISCAGFHLPSDVSDFGKGHTLDLAYIMEERRHELAYLHREQQLALAAAGAPGQGSIQPIITPGEPSPCTDSCVAYWDAGVMRACSASSSLRRWGALQSPYYLCISACFSSIRSVLRTCALDLHLSAFGFPK